MAPWVGSPTAAIAASSVAPFALASAANLAVTAVAASSTSDACIAAESTALRSVVQAQPPGSAAATAAAAALAAMSAAARRALLTPGSACELSPDESTALGGVSRGAALAHACGFVEPPEGHSHSGALARAPTHTPRLCKIENTDWHDWFESYRAFRRKPPLPFAPEELAPNQDIGAMIAASVRK